MAGVVTGVVISVRRDLSPVTQNRQSTATVRAGSRPLVRHRLVASVPSGVTMHSASAEGLILPSTVTPAASAISRRCAAQAGCAWLIQTFAGKVAGTAATGVGAALPLS